MSQELEELKKEVNAITIDGPSGIHFKRILVKLIDIQIEKEKILQGE